MKFITQHMKQLAMVAYAFALAFTLGGCVNDLTNNEHRAENKETGFQPNGTAQDKNVG